MQQESGDGGGARRLGKGLGWFSLGLGVPLLIMPRSVGRLIGVGDGPIARVLLRFVGARELLSAYGILRRPDQRAWLWSRVGGDSMDLMLLSGAMAGGGHARRVGVTMGAVSAAAALDGIAVARMSGDGAESRARSAAESRARSAAERAGEAASRAGEAASRAGEVASRGGDVVRRTGGTARQALRSVRGGREDGTRSLSASVTVRAPREEVYRFWRDFENLPRFMQHLDRVVSYQTLSHWEATAPMGRTIEWDAELVEDRPNEFISWRTVVGSGIDASGTVTFVDAPGDRGTEIKVALDYAMPAGALGRAIAKIFGEEPEQQVRDDLRRFKQVLETGEVIRSEGAPEGVDAGRQLRRRRAQPPRAA
jgi:uncharacterized membrane protein